MRKQEMEELLKQSQMPLGEKMGRVSACKVKRGEQLIVSDV